MQAGASRCSTQNARTCYAGSFFFSAISRFAHLMCGVSGLGAAAPSHQVCKGVISCARSVGFVICFGFGFGLPGAQQLATADPVKCAGGSDSGLATQRLMLPLLMVLAAFATAETMNCTWVSDSGVLAWRHVRQQAVFGTCLVGTLIHHRRRPSFVGSRFLDIVLNPPPPFQPSPLFQPLSACGAYRRVGNN